MTHDCHQYEAALKALADIGNFSQPMAGEVSVKVGASTSAMNPFSLNWSMIANGFH